MWLTLILIYWLTSAPYDWKVQSLHRGLNNPDFKSRGLSGYEPLKTIPPHPHLAGGGSAANHVCKPIITQVVPWTTHLSCLCTITVTSVITSSSIWASPVSWFNQGGVEEAAPHRLWPWALGGSGSWQPLFCTLRSPELPSRESVTAGENFWRGPRVPQGREDPSFWGPCQSSRRRNETLVDCPVLVPIWRQSYVRPHTRAEETALQLNSVQPME